MHRDNPFRGFRSFALQDYRALFGRDKEVQALVRRVVVDDERLHLLYAQSGAGKTSVLGAGFVPRLMANDWLPVSCRLLDSPFERLREAVVDALLPSPAATVELLERLSEREFQGEVTLPGARDVRISNLARELEARWKDDLPPRLAHLILGEEALSVEDHLDSTGRLTFALLAGFISPRAFLSRFLFCGRRPPLESDGQWPMIGDVIEWLEEIEAGGDDEGVEALRSLVTEAEGLTQFFDGVRSCFEQRLEQSEAWRGFVALDGIIVILDQFEELLVLRPTRNSEADTAVEKWAFLAELRRFVLAQEGTDRAVWPPIQTVISIREDHLGELEPLLADFPGLITSGVRLDHLTRDQAREVIESTAAQRGVRFSKEGLDAVLERLKIDGYFVKPVLLQALCRSIWLKWVEEGAEDETVLPAEDFFDPAVKDFEILSVILDESIERALAKLEAGQWTFELQRCETKRILAKLFLSSSARRQPQSEAELVSVPTGFPKLRRQIIHGLKREAVVRQLPTPDRGAWLELAHETLAEACQSYFARQSQRWPQIDRLLDALEILEVELQEASAQNTHLDQGSLEVLTRQRDIPGELAAPGRAAQVLIRGAVEHWPSRRFAKEGFTLRGWGDLARTARPVESEASIEAGRKWFLRLRRAIEAGDPAEFKRTIDETN